MLGTISRMFPQNSTMNQVYDWVGSLNLIPEHFRLVYPVSREILLPEMAVIECANCVLNMSECEGPISLVHDDSRISAIGFAENEDLSAENVISNQELEKLCKERKSQMVTVNPPNIVEDMMLAYVDTEMVKSFITIRFSNECGLDFDGIKREAYSLFWENAIPRYFEGTCTLVPRVSPGIDEKVYTILGRLLWHGYVLSGVFPVSVNKVFVALMLAGKDSISDEDFLEGFLEYVSSYKRLKLPHILSEDNLSGE